VFRNANLFMSSSLGGGGHEILTLQLGRASCFAGAHFWNAQDELCALDHGASSAAAPGEHAQLGEFRPELLYRVAEHSRTPRLLALDFAKEVGGFVPLQALQSENVLGLSDSELTAQASATWDGSVQVSRVPPVEKNEFLQWLDHEQTTESELNDQGSESDVDLYESKQVKENQIVSWGDFLKANIHERSVKMIQRPSDSEFSTFTSGVDCTESRMENILESVRFFMEECDSLQGVHALVDVNNGFGSIGARIVQEIRDECKTAAILTLGIVGPEKIEKSELLQKRRFNEALAMDAFTEYGNLYIPIPLYSLRDKPRGKELARFKADSLFHVTSLVGAALDCVSSPYRKRVPSHGPQSILSLRELCSRVAPTSNSQVAGVQVGFPFSGFEFEELRNLEEFFGNLSAYDESTSKSAFPIDLSSLEDVGKGKIYGSSISLRGSAAAAKDLFILPKIEEVVGKYALRTRLAETVFPAYCASYNPFPITLAFPAYFESDPPPVSVAVISCIASSTKMLPNIIDAVKALARPRNAILKASYGRGKGGKGEEDLDAIQNKLEEFAYRE